MRVVVPILTFLACVCAPAQSTQQLEWSKPFPPHRVIGNVYFVGSVQLASFLITTPDGHILINSGYEETVPVIRVGVEKLGFRFGDIRILLSSHAHTDHVGGNPLVKKLTGARVMVMRGDEKATPGRVDVVLGDGDQVKLGGVSLVARHTPGHTKGCTAWTWVTEEGGRKYNVVVHGSTNVNPGYKLVGNTEYPQIADNYARSMEVMKKLPCDVFLGPHPSFYGMQEKFAKLGKGGPNPFIDPDGYREFVANQERLFLTKLEEQKKAAR